MSADNMVQCESCGKGFCARPSRVAKGEARFCSLKCRDKGHSEERTCARCGKLFRVELNRAESGRGTHCSRACRVSPVSERFWAKVNKSGPVPGHVPEVGNCWEWTGARDQSGYGFFRVKMGETMKKAHRVSWELSGKTTDGLLVLHRCDNPACVNPSHLFLGTNLENCLDKISKGRGNFHRGTTENRVKLSPEQVSLIENSTSPCRELSRVFGVSRSKINRIRKRRPLDQNGCSASAPEANSSETVP